MEKLVYLDGNSLTIEQVVDVCRHGAKVALTEEAKKAVQISRDIVEENVSAGKVVYGLSTGFGKFVNVAIPEEDLDLLQYNLIVSDACGVGDPFKEDVTRAIMLLRINALAKGFSGIRLSTVETLVEMLNKGVHPVIPEKGSVGSSGDLCPLAHMVMPMIGEGEAIYQGKLMSGQEAMKAAGIPVISLKAKEGLALINGTCAMTGVGSLAVYDASILIKTADIAASLTVDALEGIISAFDPRIHAIRPHKGQIDVASNLRQILDGSGLTVPQGELRVQDAYTLRCVPQIHGASRLAYDYVRKVIETELNSVTDNPLIFPDNGDIFSGGNFHGQPVAVAMDTLGIAMAEYANVSERRIERLVNPALSGLPAFLTPVEGLNDGFMVAQYSAAALVSENKVLAHPACVDSIPTSANQEDHVSMGTISARKAATIISHVQSVLAVELICAAQAIDFKDSSKLGKGTRAAYELLRSEVTFMETDRAIYLDMNKVTAQIRAGKYVQVVEQAAGTLR
ncbi:MAG: histidine ammonia-lyase [Saccharofermentanales bacterium]|jgi:histidine ammonia-lyase|nr:histidine ammonia-lyase [Clostridiaceae bacterium]